MRFSYEALEFLTFVLESSIENKYYDYDDRKSYIKV